MWLLGVGISALVGVLFGALALLGLRNRRWATSLLVVFGPGIDAALVAFLADWSGLGSVQTLLAGGLGGLLSSLLIPAFFWPRRALTARLAFRQITARPKQATLLVLALVVSSSIVSSSLVVGDSLDATVSRQVEAVWTETDLVISGRDPATAQPIPIEEAMWTSVADNLDGVLDASNSPIFDGLRATWARSAAVSQGNGTALPSVGWFAQTSIVDNDPWPALRPGSDPLTYDDLGLLSTATGRHEAAVTLPLAEALNLSLGDSFNLSWSTVEEGIVVRNDAVLYVQAVLPTDHGAAIGGLDQPAVLTSFSTALEVGGGHATSLHLSASTPFSSSTEVDAAIDALRSVLDEAWTAGMEGLTIEAVEGGVALVRESGLGRLQADLVSGLRTNLSMLTAEGTMSELVQLPLEVLEVGDVDVLALPDSEVRDLLWSDDGLWVFGETGAGVMVKGTGSALRWTVPDGKVLVDHAVVNGTAWLASDAGLHRWDRAGSDDGPREVLDRPSLSVLYLNGTVWSLIETSDGVALDGFSPDGALRSSHVLPLAVPDPLLKATLFDENGSLLVELEGLEGTATSALRVVDGLLVATSSSSLPPPPAGPVDPEAVLAAWCDGRTGVVDILREGLAWCGGQAGLIGWDMGTGEPTFLRLSAEAEIDGLGRIPSMFIGLGGDQPPAIAKGEVVLGPALDPLALGTGDAVWVAGSTAWAWGDATRYRLNVTFDETNVSGLLGLEDLAALVVGLVHVEEAARLGGMEAGDRSMVVLTSSSMPAAAVETDVRAWLDGFATFETSGLEANAVRLDAAEQAEASAGLFASMFLVFGGFTIAAGTLLAVTVIVLLVEARRRDMATLRALGMTRADARNAALLEGMVLASMAGLFGGVIGVVLGRIVAFGFSSAFEAAGATAFAFGWSWSSVAAGALWGCAMAMVALSLMAAWSSRMDVLHALRGVRVRARRDLPWQVLLAVVGCLGASATAGLSLVLSGPDSTGARLLWLLVGSGCLIALSLVGGWVVPALRSRTSPSAKRRLQKAPYRSTGAAAIAVLVWTWWPDRFDPVRASTGFDELSLLVVGLVQVLAAVVALVTVVPAVLRWRSAKGRRPRLVARLAVAHPMAQPVRTAVVMAMFAVTVFAVVVLGGYTSQFTAVSADFVQESEGEFEVLLTGSMSAPLLIDRDPATWGLPEDQVVRIDAVAPVSRAVVLLDAGQEDAVPYILRGADSSFANHGGLALHLWDTSLGSTEDEVWATVLARDDLVLVDASFGLESATDGAAVGLLALDLGESVRLVQPGDPANAHTVQVAGYLAQSSLAFSPGIWVNQTLVDERFDGAVTRVYVSVPPDVVPLSSDPTEVEVPPGKGVEERRAAAGVAESIEGALSEEGVHVTLLVDDVLLVRSLVIAILDIFRAYLSLGLGVGLLGIGVVTARAVRERTGVIGLLRAIGMPRRAVGASLLGEVAWTGGFGLVVGAAVGLVFHVQLHHALWAEQGASLVLPWGTALGVVTAGAVLVMLAVAEPVRRASAIPPAVALRSSE